MSEKVNVFDMDFPPLVKIAMHMESIERGIAFAIIEALDAEQNIILTKLMAANALLLYKGLPFSERAIIINAFSMGIQHEELSQIEGGVQ